MATLFVLLSLMGAPKGEDDFEYCAKFCYEMFEFCVDGETGRARVACLAELRQCLNGCRKK